DGARAGREDSDLHAVGGALDLDTGHIALAGSLLDVLTDLVVLQERRPVAFLAVIPMAVVTPDDADSEANWMYFLAHSYSSPFSSVVSPGSLSACGVSSICGVAEPSSSGASEAVTGVASSGSTAAASSSGACASGSA